MENEIKRVYSGSVVNAEYIGSVLAENDIQFLIRNFQEESLVAGWAAGTIKGDASVYVFNKDYDRAMLLKWRESKKIRARKDDSFPARVIVSRSRFFDYCYI